MNKRLLLKIATSVCFMFYVMLIGQVTAFADEVKPIYEYNFDKDNGSTVIDTGSKKVNGTFSGEENHDRYIIGYNGEGRARHFDVKKNQFIKCSPITVPITNMSIRFKIRKSTYNGSIIYINNKRGGNNFCININDGGRLEICQDNSVFYRSVQNICNGKWHDVLLTINNGSFRVYIDDMTTSKKTGNINIKKESYNDDKTLIIGSSSEKYSNGFTGDLDNIQIYDSVIKPDTTSLTATGGESIVDLSWHTVEGADKYIIRRSNFPGGPYTKIKEDVKGTTYEDTSPKKGTTYYYVVTAIIKGKEGRFSNEVTVTPGDKNDEGSTTDPGDTEDTGNTADNKLKVILELAEKLQLSVDKDIDKNKEMTWTSSDSSVATVDKNGIVTALALGNTNITVTGEDGTYTDSINILVVENAEDYRLTLDLKVGKSRKLTVADSSNTVEVNWVSMDTSVVKVSSKGRVKAVSEGLALVTALDKDANIIGKVYVRVRE